MAIRKRRPTSAGRRFQTSSDFSDITKSKPEKTLVRKKTSKGGRNAHGRITSRHQGGGHKQQYRVVDFKRNYDLYDAKVAAIEYDPNRTCRIALLHYADGSKAYILAPKGLEVGMRVQSGPKADIKVGNAMPLRYMPVGTMVHNIELRPGQGAKMARSAGSYAQLSAREGKYAVLRLPSGETRMILTTCIATIGSVSNPDHNLRSDGKAGRNRWLGRRPRTRPVAMNPVDHPMGGGEGRASGGHPRSRKGTKSKGLKTRFKAKASNKYIIERRKK